MINDFFKEFLTKNSIMDDYGLKYNHNYNNEIKKINNEYSISLLSNKALIKCTGKDVENFLNTQFTNDLNNLKKNKIILSGYCNLKGRILSVFYIFQLDNEYYLYTTLDSVESLLNKLNMYKMALKVEFKLQKEILIGITNNEKNNNLDIQSENNEEIKKINNSIIFKIFKNQTIISTNLDDFRSLFYNNDSNLLGYKAWDYLDTKNLIPFVKRSAIELYTPQMLSLDLIDGVSYTKGCYPGQEIVARTHYLGESKKALFHIDIISNHNIDISSKIINHKSDKIAGDIINIVKIDDDKYSCLSVLRKEFVDSELTINKNDSVRIVRGVKSD